MTYKYTTFAKVGRLTEIISVLNVEPKKLNSIKPLLHSFIIPHDISSIRRSYRKGLSTNVTLELKNDEAPNMFEFGENQHENKSSV